MVSEEGSLYSMRSGLSPHSALSASGTAPASNSNSLHSLGVTGSSLKSLAHSSSVSSIDRRPPTRRSPKEVSPPLSATGQCGHRLPLLIYPSLNLNLVSTAGLASHRYICNHSSSTQWSHPL